MDLGTAFIGGATGVTGSGCAFGGGELETSVTAGASTTRNDSVVVIDPPGE